jgi:hypothetical protein
VQCSRDEEQRDDPGQRADTARVGGQHRVGGHEGACHAHQNADQADNAVEPPPQGLGVDDEKQADASRYAAHPHTPALGAAM